MAAALISLIGNIAHQSARQQVQPGTPFDLGEAITLTGAGYIVGRTTATWPDAMEPATHPRHRGTLHSWGAGALVVYGAAHVAAADVPPAMKFIAGAAAAGYLAHLLADAATPHGLPFF